MLCGAYARHPHACTSSIPFARWTITSRMCTFRGWYSWTPTRPNTAVQHSHGVEDALMQSCLEDNSALIGKYLAIDAPIGDALTVYVDGKSVRITYSAIRGLCAAPTALCQVAAQTSRTPRTRRFFFTSSGGCTVHAQVVVVALAVWTSTGLLTGA